MNDVMILGAGAVGCLVGGHLAAQGYKVELVNRSPATAQAIAERGLIMELDRGTERLRPDAAQLDEASPARFVMLCTKAYQTDAAIRAVRHHLIEDCVMVSLQNGLGNAEHIAQVTGLPVLQGVTMIPSTLVGPAHVRSHGSHTSWLGPLDPDDQVQKDASQQLTQMFNQSGLACDYEVKVHTRIWHKACFNVAMNAVCALTDGPPGLVCDTPELMAQAHALADEALAVAHAHSVGVDAAALHAMIDFAVREHRFHQPSMLQDMRADRETEIESLNGFVVKAARRLGIAVPRNELIYALVQARQSAAGFWKQQSKSELR